MHNLNGNKEIDAGLLKRGLRKFVTNRYTFLFIAIVVLFVMLPFQRGRGIILVPLLYLFLLLGVFRALRLQKTLLCICIGLSVLAFALSMSGRIADPSFESNLASSLTLAGRSLNALFLLFAIIVLNYHIFTERQVTADTIQGGISVYFLIGILWAILFQIIILVDPGAIGPGDDANTISSCTYFSFVTLTTLGYGDMTPVAWPARTLAILEAAFGQIYLTVFIARLVGLHLSQSWKKR